MSLLSTRDYYKPFEYPWMYDYYKLQNQMHWTPESVPLHTDVKDWQDITEPPNTCLLYTSPSPRDGLLSRMPSSA